MEIRTGVDIIEVNRIKESIEQIGQVFVDRIFTEKEQEYCEKSNKMKYQHYAARFAAKEAIYKAMSKFIIENNLTISYLDVEILNIEELSRRPKVYILNEEIKKACDKHEVEIDVSISHVKDNAISTVVVKVNKE